MKLSINDFELGHIYLNGYYFYKLTDAALVTCTNRDDYSMSYWLLDVKKQEVLDFLGWEKPKLKYHIDLFSEGNTYYPEFLSKEEALIYTLTAIVLHNETQP